MIRLISYAVFTCLLLQASATSAQGTNNKKTDLVKINQQINRLARAQTKAKHTQSQLTNELKHTELLISKLHINIEKIEHDMTQETANLERLDREQTHLKKQLKIQQTLLIKQLKLQMRLGKYPLLEWLLYQRNPTLSARLLNYLRFINQSRSQTIRHVKNLKQDLASRTKQQKETLRQLKVLKQNKESEFSLLNSQTAHQKTLLQNLQKQILSDKHTLHLYLKDKKRLEKIIARLNKAKALQQTLFSHAKGKLPWPVEGKLLNYFNVKNNEIINNGLVFNAKAGSQVRAVFAGKVVFSDWLKGFGLLLIINHGKDFMTLYANNQALYHKSGDNIKQGELIARVGHSGGQIKDGLYFEIRHKGKAIYPKPWLQSHG